MTYVDLLRETRPRLGMEKPVGVRNLVIVSTHEYPTADTVSTQQLVD